MGLQGAAGTSPSTGLSFGLDRLDLRSEPFGDLTFQLADHHVVGRSFRQHGSKTNLHRVLGDHHHPGRRAHLLYVVAPAGRI